MIFLDLGAWNGASIKHVRQNISNDCKIIAFEPLPDNITILRDMKKVWGFELIEKACTAYDGVDKFYTGQTESGSLSRAKRTGGLDGETCVFVETIDFPAWFAEWYKPHYDVTIKMNIEGAEYPILSKMNDMGLLKHVDKWYIQWHYNKVRILKDEHDRISNLIDWEPWNVM